MGYYNARIMAFSHPGPQRGWLVAPAYILGR